MNDYSNFTIDNIIAIFDGLVCWLSSIAGAVMVIFIIIAGIRFMFAGGSSEKVDEAKKNLRWVLIGVLVILGANVIINTIAAAVGSSVSLIPFKCL